MDYVVRSGPKISLDHNRIRRVFFCHPSPQGACRSLLRMNTISEMNHTYQVFQIRPLSAEWSRRQQRNLDQLPDSLKRWEGGSWVFELDSTLRLGVVRIKSSNGKSPFCGGPRNENLKKIHFEVFRANSPNKMDPSLWKSMKTLPQNAVENCENFSYLWL